MKFSSVEIIYNPNSTGPSQNLAKELQAELKSALPKLSTHLHATKYTGHAEKLTYQLAKKGKSPLIVSSSGDGGYNEVINGAMRARTAGARSVCAVLAAGNANDHSRTLVGDSLTKLIEKQQVSSIDLLKVSIEGGRKKTERYAHSYVGFGLTPVVAAELNKTNLNALKELWIILKTFYRYRPIRIKVDEKMLKLDSIIFANIGEMAKILTISKHARPNDGKFEIATFKHAQKFRLIQKLVKATVQGLDTKQKYKEFTFTTLKKMPAQLDGEVLRIPKHADITVTAEAGVLRTLIS